MGETTGFMKYGREDFKKEPVKDRVQHWKEIYLEMPEEDIKTQGARCMDCGVPFVRKDAPLVILFRIGMILFTATNGKML